MLVSLPKVQFIYSIWSFATTRLKAAQDFNSELRRSQLGSKFLNSEKEKQPKI